MEKLQFEELLTKKELANAFKVKNVKTIERYTKEGMPMFSEKPIRFLESECRKWLQTRKRKK